MTDDAQAVERTFQQAETIGSLKEALFQTRRQLIPLLTARLGEPYERHVKAAVAIIDSTLEATRHEAAR